MEPTNSDEASTHQRSEGCGLAGFGLGRWQWRHSAVSALDHNRHANPKRARGTATTLKGRINNGAVVGGGARLGLTPSTPNNLGVQRFRVPLLPPVSSRGDALAQTGLHRHRIGAVHPQGSTAAVPQPGQTRRCCRPVRRRTEPLLGSLRRPL